MAVETWLVLLGTAPCVVAAFYAMIRYLGESAATGEPGYLDEMHRTRGSQPQPFASWEETDAPACAGEGE